MKNLKKLLAVLVVVVMVITTMIPAFAASYTYSTQAQALYDIGLLKGSTTGAFEPNLGAALDRQQGVVMLIRLLGKEPAALALTSTDVNATLIIFSDADKLATWAKKHIAYAVLYKYVAGLPNGTFAPNNPLTGKEFGTMLLRAAGYTVDAAGYAGACYQLNVLGVLTFSEAAKFNEKELIRDDFVGMAYAVLQMKYKATGLTLIQTLINDKVVTEAKASAAGVFNDQLYAAARAAVDAYKAGPITTLAEIAAAEAKKAAADAAVAKVVVAATKTALQNEVTARANAIAAAKTALMDSINGAVNAFLAAPITTLAEITAAEALAVTAQAKVATVADAAVKADLTKKVNDQLAVIAAKKADLSGAKIAVDTGSLAKATITFDKPISAATLANNIKIDGVVVPAARYYLAADLKTLTVVYAALKNQSDNVRVQLSNVKDTLGVTIAAFDQTFVVKDVTDPQVTGVSVVNPKVIKIFVSEPLNVLVGGFVVTDLLNAQINIMVGGQAGYAMLTQNAAQGFIQVEYSGTLPTGDSSILIADAKDNAGYKMAQFTGTINVIADTVAPVATAVEYLTNNTVKVTFSENVAAGANPYGGIATYTFKESGGAEVVPINAVYSNNTVTLTLPANMTVAAIVGFEVSYVNVQDNIGNTSGATKKIIAGTAPDDATAPTVTSIAVIAGNKVRVTFSEAVNVAAANFELYNSTGATKLETCANAPVAVAGSGNKQYDITFNTLTPAAGIDAANYQVQVVASAAYFDFSIRGNVGVAFPKTTILTLDTKKPVLTAAVGTTVAGGIQTIELIFSEAMNTALTGNVANYFIGRTDSSPAASTADVPLDTISGASVAVNAPNKVTLTVPNTGAAYVVVAAYIVKDPTGNVLNAANIGSTINNAFVIQGTYAPYQLGAADITVKAVTKTSIEIIISAAKVAAGYTFTLADKNAFTFVSNDVYNTAINLAVIGAMISSDGTKVTLTTAVELNTDATSGVANTPVKMWINNAAGLVRDQNNQAVLIAIGDNEALTDGIKPIQQALAVTDAVADGVAKVVIPFSEPVAYTAAAGIDSAVKVTVDGKVLYPESDYNVVITAGGAVEVQIAAIQGGAWAAGVVKAVTVQIITATNFKDAAGNVIVPGAAAAVNATF